MRPPTAPVVCPPACSGQLPGPERRGIRRLGADERLRRPLTWLANSTAFWAGQVLRRGFDPYIVKALMSELEHHGPELHAGCSPTRLERDATTGKISLTVMRDGKEEVRGPLPAPPRLPLPAPPPATRPCLAHTHTLELPSPLLRSSGASTQCSRPSAVSRSLTRCSWPRQG